MINEFEENFTEEVDLDDISDSDNESQQSNDNYVDKKNVNSYLQNPKVCKGRGCPPGTKRLKSSHEVVKPKTKQQHQCKKCENVGHYQKNCKEMCE
ncbi:12526_t:CDS:2 [Dentiscutata erythropus]|uniref:12526_t:CDS:1 n=1 Tax=Dentiscutata erythropus TaxID=1348616 RepID=A0A9N9BT30_9GLOM|nr:12526_t:CDS:2 [Dentiscutata erythropus]